MDPGHIWRHHLPSSYGSANDHAAQAQERKGQRAYNRERNRVEGQNTLQISACFRMGGPSAYSPASHCQLPGCIPDSIMGLCSMACPGYDIHLFQHSVLGHGKGIYLPIQRGLGLLYLLLGVLSLLGNRGSMLFPISDPFHMIYYKSVSKNRS